MFWGPKVESVTAEELRAALKRGAPILIDVREPYEFAAGHVPGARNLPLGGLPSSAAKLDHDAEVYVICQSGNRSARATKRLMKAGFTNVRNVRGGTSAWPGNLKR